jgi:hypothetical protein
MNKLYWLIGLLAISIFAGCESDIVTTDRLKMLEHTARKRGSSRRASYQGCT